MGLAKTAVGGLGTIAVAIYAAALPARESTAALLLVLIVGDVIAVRHYHHDCDWRLIRHLVPGVLPGLVLGSVVLAVVDDATLRRGIGGLLLALLLLQLWLRRADSRAEDRAEDRAGAAAPAPWRLPARLSAGVGTGFATMVANSAGPVMTLYLLAQRVDKLRFLGTSAWFFLCVNLAKVPFSAALGLLSIPMVAAALLLTPVVLAGGLVGARWARGLRQRSFEVAVLLASALSAGLLLLP